jgi:acetylornithine deacetylase/succinyl-diaminopimelate desuccinylase-like protein
MERAGVRKELESVVVAALPLGVSSRVRITSAHQPFLGATSGPLLDAIVNAHREIVGKPPVVTNALPGQAFVTDAATLAAVGLETVVYGAADWHFAPNESVDINELTASARVYLAVALSLGATASPQS